MSTLPYVTAPGNIEKALRAIKSAATPENVSQDFVKTILGIPGGSGNQITSFLRKIDFVQTDGRPSELYRRFRNSQSSGSAVAEAIRVGYAPLYRRNEYMHRLTDTQLKGLIIEETGQGEDSTTIPLILACIKGLKKFASWDKEEIEESDSEHVLPPEQIQPSLPSHASSTNFRNESVGMNLSYTINLNLPATNDIAVFNAIFKSLKENLLRSTNG